MLAVEKHNALKRAKSLKEKLETLEVEKETLVEEKKDAQKKAETLEEEKEKLEQSNQRMHGEWRGLMEDVFGKSEMVTRDLIQTEVLPCRQGP